VHEECQEFSHHVEPLCIAVCLEALVLEIERALLRNTPQDECRSGTDFRQRAFTTLEVPFALDTHTRYSVRSQLAGPDGAC